MPEGDTVHKIARFLAPRLEGRSLERIWLRDRGDVSALSGARVREVAALGKHLLVDVLAPASPSGAGSTAQGAELEHERAWVVHVHLGMNGRWDHYRPDEAWRRPRSQASVVLATGDRWFVCFRAAVAQLVRRREISAIPRLRRLGPDLLSDRWTPEAAVARARGAAPHNVADLLLDQRIVCGLGNVYKNEVLFLEGVHPRTPARHLGDDRLADLYARGRALMLANLGGWRRTTLRPVTAETAPRRGEPRFWVHERAGRPCWRCGARIAWARIGDAARPAYWCPRCQPELESAASASAPQR